MQLKLITGGPTDCSDKHCPTVYETESGSFVVQGYTVTEAVNADLAPGESLVEVPASLIQGLLHRI